MIALSSNTVLSSRHLMQLVMLCLDARPPSASLILVYVCFSSYCQVYEYRNVCLLLCGLRAALIV